MGLSELRRVASRQVILFAPRVSRQFWLVEYFPEWPPLPSEMPAPSVEDLRRHLDIQTVVSVPVPADCVDDSQELIGEGPGPHWT